MYICVGEYPGAKNYRLLDLEIGEEISGVIWAGDVKGKYCRYVRDADGAYHRTKDGEGLETETLTGNIKLEKTQ